MAAATPSPSGRMLVNFTGISPAATSFDSGFIDVSFFAYFRITCTCSDQNHKFIVRWSTNGLTVHDSITSAVTPAGNMNTDVLTVKARYGRFTLDLTGPSANAQLQCFFFESLTAGSLKNLGTGAKIYSLTESGIRSVRSSDLSLTVTESATEIDVTVSPAAVVKSLDHAVPPFANSYSIVKDLTPATGNVILNWLTDNNGTDGGVVFTSNPAGYLTAKATLSGVTLGSAGGPVSLVNDGTGPSLALKGLTPGLGMVLADSGSDVSIGSSIFSPSGLADGTGTIQNIFGGNFIMGNIYTDPVSFSGCSNSAILACAGSTLTNGLLGAIVASSGSNITKGTANNLRNFIGGCQNASITSSASHQANNCAIVGGNATFNATAGECRNSGALGCDSSTFTAANISAQVATQLCSMTSTGIMNLMLSAASCTISGTQNHNIVMGRSVTSSGGHSFSCNLSTTGSLTTTTSEQWTVKSPGGAIYYSDDAGTIGVSLAAGGNSWVAVSDINVKENLQEMCYLDCLEGIANLPVYDYNFIGNPTTQRCFGPVAQDWNRIFPAGKYELGIDQGDAIGVSLAGIKGLVVWMKSLEERLNKLEGK